MDLYTIPSKKLNRTSRNWNQTQQDFQILGKASPINKKQRDQGIYSNRYPTQNEGKCKEQGILCELFENIHINQTFICKSQHNSFDHHQTRLFTPEARILKKRKNGKAVFQPIPRLCSIQRTYDSPAVLNITSYMYRKQPKVRRVINLNMLKDECEKRPFFSDKGQNLYDDYKLLWRIFLIIPPIFQKELFIFKEFLDRKKDLCNKFQSILLSIISIRKRPKKYINEL